MSRFVFRLETLLRIHKQTRDQRRGELAEAYRVDETLRQKLSHIDAQVAAMRNYCRLAASPGAVNVDRLVEAQRYEITLSGQQRGVQQQRDAVAEQIELRRQALVEADREVRVLEKLRERKAEEHLREEEVLEVKRLDEVATVQTYRASQLERQLAQQASESTNHEP